MKTAGLKIHSAWLSKSKQPTAVAAGWCCDWPDDVWRAGLGLDLVFHPKAGAFDDYRLGVMEEPVQDGRGEGAVIVEDAGPLFEGFVGGQHDGAALVALADDLEEQIGAMLVDRQVAELIQD